MFTISNKRGHARARISTTHAINSSFTSLTNGCSLPPDIFIPQMPQPVYPTIMSKPKPLTIVTKIDLKLRLSQPGTSVSKIRGARRVSKTNPSLEVPEYLKLTLGLKNQGQDTGRRGGLSITEKPLTRIQVHPTKTKGFARSGGAKPKKRDYYGPCVRCGTIFETSQHYAGHMRGHSRKDETAKKKASLAKKLQDLMFMKL